MTPVRNATGPDRPLGARSLVASLLLRSEPPRMKGARLVQWCGLFGVSEGTARVALSRMVERGELRSADGTYELAGRVGGRRPAQDWSISPRPSAWDGDWRVAVVTGERRAAAKRGALRDAMRRLRMGQLREGTWTRPDNLPRASAPSEVWNVADAQCEWWTATPDEDAAEMARRLFDPNGWAKDAVRLCTRLEAATRRLAHASDRQLADGFVVGARTVAHLRADPLLPAALGPSADAGDALRNAYRAYESAFSAALHAWFQTHA